MVVCKNKFWIERFLELFCSPDLIPVVGMSLEQQLNALSRLIFIVSFAMCLINFKWSILFLVLSLIFIIILYYIKKKKMEKEKLVENYVDTLPRYLAYEKPPKSPKVIYFPVNKDISVKEGNMLGNWEWDGENIKLVTPEQFRFCKDQRRIIPGPEFQSANQRLATPPNWKGNPKTRECPVITPPPAALDFWRANALVTHSHINKATPEDVYQMGYVVSTCCGYNDNKVLVPSDKKYQPPLSLTIPRVSSRDASRSSSGENKQEIKENFELPKYSTPIAYQFPYNDPKTPNPRSEDPRSRYALPSHKLGPSTPGDVLTSCGYNPEQLYQSDLPTNLMSGNCVQDPVFKNQNKKVFTQMIQPGVYQNQQIIEPLNNNIGISFTQQFPPTTCSMDKDQQQTYTQHDPRLMEPEPYVPNLEVIEGVNNSNIVDPRFYGYGDSTRSYIDKVTGRPRFYYDDVNVIRRPNYLTRSKIDFQPYADSYGPMKTGEVRGNKYNSMIRALAQDSFMRDSLTHRNDMMERLMRKRNTELWQVRQYPKGPGGYNAGAGGCGGYPISGGGNQ